MVFKNKKHAERSFDASSDSKIKTSDRELLASIYLLTSYKKIWKRFENALDEKNGIDPEAFDKFEPKDATEYALVTAACDILFCSEFLNLSDFADSDTIPDKAFLAICYAIGYARYGFDECQEQVYPVLKQRSLGSMMIRPRARKQQLQLR